MYVAIAYTSFQLTHITREDCAVQVARAGNGSQQTKKIYHSIHNFATLESFGT